MLSSSLNNKKQKGRGRDLFDLVWNLDYSQSEQAQGPNEAPDFETYLDLSFPELQQEFDKVLCIEMARLNKTEEFEKHNRFRLSFN